MIDIKKEVCQECELRKKSGAKWYSTALSYWPLICVVTCIGLVAWQYLSTFYNEIHCDSSIYLCEALKSKPEVWGQFGDFVGGLLNPIVGICTIILLIATLNLSRVELKEARVAATKAANAQVKMEESMRTQLDIAQSQNNLVNYYTHLEEFQKYFTLIGPNHHRDVGISIFKPRKMHIALFSGASSGRLDVQNTELRQYLELMKRFCEALLLCINGNVESATELAIRDVQLRIYTFLGHQQISQSNEIKITGDENYGLLNFAFINVWHELKLAHELLSFDVTFDDSRSLIKILDKLRPPIDPSTSETRIQTIRCGAQAAMGTRDANNKVIVSTMIDELHEYLSQAQVFNKPSVNH
jgi:fumarate reductase subunit C